MVGTDGPTDGSLAAAPPHGGLANSGEVLAIHSLRVRLDEPSVQVGLAGAAADAAARSKNGSRARSAPRRSLEHVGVARHVSVNRTHVVGERLLAGNFDVLQERPRNCC